MSTTLQQHLDRCYAQAIGYRHPDVTAGTHARQDFAAALSADPALRLEAEARQKSLVDAVTQKCYLSRTHKAVLDQLLGG